MPDTDIAIIGAGAAGLSVAAISAALGFRVTLIERGEMGGDCLNTGCVPSKALLAVAHLAAEARRAPRYGVVVPPPVIDWALVQASVKRAIGTIAPHDSEERFRAMGVEVLRAAAHFTGRDSLDVGGRRLVFRRAVIAAGSRAVVPAVPGLGQVPFLTHETIFDLPACPEHLLVLGGGPIGLEMALAHRRLGARVTVVEQSRIASREDEECVAVLRAALLAEGVELREGGGLAEVTPAPGGLTARLADGTQVGASHLLVAVGRAARVEGLGLEAAGLVGSARGVATNLALRAEGNRRIWVAGDIADPVGLGPRAFTHVASQHAGIIARSMLFRLPVRLDYAALPRVTYTDPELAQIGLTEAEARAAHGEVRVLRRGLGENDRLVAEDRAEGLIKLIASPRGRLLGASVVGPRAGDMAGMLGLMVGRRLPLSALAGVVLPYPTVQEAAKRAAGDFYAPKLASPLVKRLLGLLKHLP